MAASLYIKPTSNKITYSRSPIILKYIDLDSNNFTYRFEIRAFSPYNNTLELKYNTSVIVQPQIFDDSFIIDLSPYIDNILNKFNYNLDFTEDNFSGSNSYMFIEYTLSGYHIDSGILAGQITNSIYSVRGYNIEKNGSINIDPDNVFVLFDDNNSRQIPLDADFLFIYNSSINYVSGASLYYYDINSGETLVTSNSIYGGVEIGWVRSISSSYKYLIDNGYNVDTSKPLRINYNYNNYYVYLNNDCNEWTSVKYRGRFGFVDQIYCYGKLSTEDEIIFNTYKRNTINKTNMTYNTRIGQYQKRNINGKRKYYLNTGWLEEWQNEQIKDLLLSEDILLNNNKWVQIIDTDVKFKSNKYDKLISYDLIFEESNDKINTWI